MGIHVYTESVCDRCGTTDRVQGSKAERPPMGWAFCTVQYSAGADSGKRVSTTLCPNCAAGAEAAMAAQK